MSWEASRSWELMRPFVYYLREDLVAPSWARNVDALDFSAGLGDLSSYLVEHGSRSVVATRPEPVVPTDGSGIKWMGGLAAGSLTPALAPSSFDLAVARMVFQFPTWEGDRADPDSMAEEFAVLLRPGGRLVIAFHEFVSFERVPSPEEPPTVDDLLAHDSRYGLHEVIKYLGLPPREGPFGETGFGLKVPMLVTTLQSRGFEVETADHPEPFTMPISLDAMPVGDLATLGDQVMALKGRYLSDPDQSPYARPAVVRAMLVELRELFEFTVWPIVRIVARLVK